MYFDILSNIFFMMVFVKMAPSLQNGQPLKLQLSLTLILYWPHMNIMLS